MGWFSAQECGRRSPSYVHQLIAAAHCGSWLCALDFCTAPVARHTSKPTRGTGMTGSQGKAPWGYLPSHTTYRGRGHRDGSFPLLQCGVGVCPQCNPKHMVHVPASEAAGVLNLPVRPFLPCALVYTTLLCQCAGVLTVVESRCSTRPEALGDRRPWQPGPLSGIVARIKVWYKLPACGSHHAAEASRMPLSPMPDGSIGPRGGFVAAVLCIFMCRTFPARLLGVNHWTCYGKNVLR